MVLKKKLFVMRNYVFSGYKSPVYNKEVYSQSNWDPFQELPIVSLINRSDNTYKIEVNWVFWNTLKLCTTC